jgi:hypothetical protein
MRLLTIRDIGNLANKKRKKDGKVEMPYLQILKVWNDLRKSNKTYDASGMVGLNYVFTPAAAKKVADAISKIEYRHYKPRKTKADPVPLNEAV